MESRMSLLTGVLAAGLLYLAVSTLARGRRDATEISPSVHEERNGGAAEEYSGITPVGCDEGVVRWIAIVVPLFAVLLMVAVFLIGAVVL
jgi:hypothetical protein